jgi:predicted nucleotidyltransferase component of viral defense system
MADSSFDLREYFHLQLLRHLAMRLAGRSYAVKGGICLRFFLRSPRLSEDMDLDIGMKMPVQTLEKAVDSVLESRALMAYLEPRGIRELSVSKPKQTATTQRWKIQLHQKDALSYSTKIEFSRRAPTIDAETGVIAAPLLSHYQLTPFGARYYAAPAIVNQKLQALASPTRNALRDLFDLHHLFFTIGVAPSAIKTVDAVVIEKTLAKIGSFQYADFKAQVIPFLSSDLLDFYRQVSAFDTLKVQVETLLMERLS